MKKINFMIAALLLSVSAAPVFAQESNVVSNAAVENEESINDEGYGADDSEYYGAEGTNEEMPEDAKEGMDTGKNAVWAAGNAQMPGGPDNADR